MSSIPPGLTRVPMTLSSRMLLGNLTRTNVQMLLVQSQLSSGRLINRPSDDSIGSSLVGKLDREMEVRGQRMRNLNSAEAMLNITDATIMEASEMTLDAKNIALEMLGFGSDAEIRRSQATIVGTMITEMYHLANESHNGVNLFGGQQTAYPPMEALLGGYRYTGTREGMTADLGSLRDMPITLSAEEAFGALSARVVGDVDLNPALTGDTRISDLNGARDLGVALGPIEIDISGAGTIAVDLTSADSAQDVMDMIDAAIAQYETDNSVSILEGARASVNSTNNGFAFDLVAGETLTFQEVGTSTAGADLGLTQAVFTDAAPDGADVDPRLTTLTNIADLSVGSLDDFVIINAGQKRTIAASTATTVQDLFFLVAQADIGVRIEINEDGQRLNIINELSGGRMSIEEVVGGTGASDLGIRSFDLNTKLDDFNGGRGVNILSGAVDEDTGLPDPARDLDFRVTLSDGTTFEVDLVGAATVNDVITIVNAAAPGTFNIALNDGDNGFLLTDSSGGGGEFSVVALNNSQAAQDLGIAGTAGGATLAGEDMATVEVNSVFSHLLALYDALMNDDDRGITIAGEALEEDTDRFSQIRAVVGQRANRIISLQTREESRQMLDLSIKSQIQDLDYAEASIRFSTLQIQLQAALSTGSQAGRLSLINFLR